MCTKKTPKEGVDCNKGCSFGAIKGKKSPVWNIKGSVGMGAKHGLTDANELPWKEE